MLIFPSDEAEDAVEFMERTKKENNGEFPYENIVFIDSTWSQTYRISHDSTLISKFIYKINISYLK